MECALVHPSHLRRASHLDITVLCRGYASRPDKGLPWKIAEEAFTTHVLVSFWLL
jgi:hypothetical protein